MKKIIYSLTVICVLSFITHSSFSYPHSIFTGSANGSKKKEIKVVSNRASGDMQLRFTTEKAEKVTIKILNDAGEMVLKQISEVKGSVNNIPLKNALDLAEGQYTVYLISGKETYSTSFLIWK
jgi:hypothetical protein